MKTREIVCTCPAIRGCARPALNAKGHTPTDLIEHCNRVPAETGLQQRKTADAALAHAAPRFCTPDRIGEGQCGTAEFARHLQAWYRLRNITSARFPASHSFAPARSSQSKAVPSRYGHRAPVHRHRLQAFRR